MIFTKGKGDWRLWLPRESIPLRVHYVDWYRYLQKSRMPLKAYKPLARA